MLNRITMTGRLVADPELRRTQSGVSVTSFRIANDRDYGKGEEKETDFLVDNAYFADSKKDDAAGDFPADDQFAGYGAYQGSVPGGGDDFAPDF